MKKLVAIIVCCSFFFTLDAAAAVIKEGDIMFTAQYGFPNLWGTLIKNNYSDDDFNIDLQVKSIGPIGGQFEFMVTDKIGLGLKVNYSNTNVVYKNDVTNSNGQITRYNYELDFPRIRFMPRFGFHFGNSEKFDAYFGVAGGPAQGKLKFISNDPNYTGNTSINLLPVAFRLDVGGNYFINEVVGINFELGIGGGPLMNAGVVFKIVK
ncbi:MAG: hypothetical protein RIQ89_897 [Bacteroidota bacterium]|jgi:hypothetical protein